MELGRSGFAPRPLGTIHARFATPVVALGVNLVAGVLAILSGKTGEIITLSCFGALSLYAISMAALFALRNKEPQLARPYRAPLYPIAPAIALLLSLISLFAMTWFNPWIAAIFGGMLAAAGAYYALAVRGNVDAGWAA
jgi:ethanolamine permease